MCTLFRRRGKPSRGVADTFVEATGGGWTSTPETVAGDGGSQADFVGKTLERARQYALENVAVGQEFEFTMKGIPSGIESPYEIIIGLMTRASDYDLGFKNVVNETVCFTRLG